MTKREALNGKPYAGNPHVRSVEEKDASTTPRRGSLLYVIGVLLVFAANASFAETWYLSKNSSGKGKGWQGDDAGNAHG